MTVYLVHYEEQDSYNQVAGVFSTLEKAYDALADAVRDKQKYIMQIQIVEADIDTAYTDGVFSKL